MSSKTIRPGLTAAMTAGRSLLAAGWRYDATSPMADDTTIRTLLHPSGREIHARTVDGDETTTLTMTGLSLEQVAGAIAGAGLGKPAEHYHVGGAIGGPGENEVECACGLVFGGFDTQAAALALLERHIANPDPAAESDPECLACRHATSEHVEDHIGCRANGCGCPFPQPAKPDFWLTLADDLRQVADRIATLAGTGVAPGVVNLHILGSVFPREAERTVPMVDALAAVFGVEAATRDEKYGADAVLGFVKVHPYTYVPKPEDPEKAALRAELEQLRAQLAGGAR